MSFVRAAILSASILMLTGIAAPTQPSQGLEPLKVTYRTSTCQWAKAPIIASVRGISLKNVYIQKQEKTYCTPAAGIVEIVLPGHPISTDVDIAPCCGDGIAYSYVAGLVDPGLDVRILRSAAVIPCGSKVDDTSQMAVSASDRPSSGSMPQSSFSSKPM